MLTRAAARPPAPQPERTITDKFMHQARVPRRLADKGESPRVDPSRHQCTAGRCQCLDHGPRSGHVLEDRESVPVTVTTGKVRVTGTVFPSLELEPCTGSFTDLKHDLSCVPLAVLLVNLGDITSS